MFFEYKEERPMFEDKDFKHVSIEGSNDETLKKVADYLKAIKKPKIIFCNYHIENDADKIRNLESENVGLEIDKDSQRQSETEFDSSIVTYVTGFDLTPMIEIKNGLTYGYNGHGTKSLQQFIQNVSTEKIEDDDLAFIKVKPNRFRSSDHIECLQVFIY